MRSRYLCAMLGRALHRTINQVQLLCQTWLSEPEKFTKDFNFVTSIILIAYNFIISRMHKRTDVVSSDMQVDTFS